MSKPYYIIAPIYRHNSAGIKVLYLLWDELRKANQNAFILNHYIEIPKNSIVVYPEIISGNPLKVDNVVRYVLNKPGLIGGDKVYNDNDMVFVYAKPFVSAVKNNINGMLHLPSVELDIFKNNKNNTRPITCYYVGKGTLDKSKIPSNCIEITKGNPESREKLANLFNYSAALYNFDPATILIQEAALCGTPTVYLADNVEEYKLSESGTNGVSFVNDKESIERARKDTSKVRDHFIKLKETFKEQLKHFIEVTQN